MRAEAGDLAAPGKEWTLSEHQAVDLLITGPTIVTMNAQRDVIERGAIAIQDDTITAVLPNGEIPESLSAKRVIQAEGKVAFPGLINSHSHLAMTLFRGFVEDLELQRWLERVWKYELSALDERAVRVGAGLAFAEMIRSGVTCAHDMYWYYEATMALAEQTGFRLISGPPMTSIGDPDVGEMTAQARRVLERYQGARFVRPVIQAHSVYTTTEEMMRVVLELRDEFNVPFTTHASETRAEVTETRERFGQTPLELLQTYALLDERAVLAHCVHLSEEEIGLLQESGAHVAHCPESNLKLGSGIAPVARMIERGVNVCLGTDGPASNNDLDLLGEMRTAALLQKGVAEDPRLLTTEQVFAMATINGARAFGLDNTIGSLEVGKQADVVLLDAHKAHLTPRHDSCANLVYAAGKGDIDMVLIAGRIQLEDGKLTVLDDEALMAEAAEIADAFR